MHYDLIKQQPHQNGYKSHNYHDSKARPDSNKSNRKFIQNHEIFCTYTINTSNYYRNVPIYNHKRTIII